MTHDCTPAQRSPPLPSILQPCPCRASAPLPSSPVVPPPPLSCPATLPSSSPVHRPPARVSSSPVGQPCPCRTPHPPSPALRSPASLPLLLFVRSLPPCMAPSRPSPVRLFRPRRWPLLGCRPPALATTDRPLARPGHLGCAPPRVRALATDRAPVPPVPARALAPPPVPARALAPRAVAPALAPSTAIVPCCCLVPTFDRSVDVPVVDRFLIVPSFDRSIVVPTLTAFLSCVPALDRSVVVPVVDCSSPSTASLCAAPRLGPLSLLLLSPSFDCSVVVCVPVV